MVLATVGIEWRLTENEMHFINLDNISSNTIFRQGGGGFNQNNGGQFQPRGRMTTPNRGGNYGQPQQQRRGGRPQGGGGNRTPLRARGMNQAAFPPKVSFDGDYDFEKANEELLTSLAKAKLGTTRY